MRFPNMATFESKYIRLTLAVSTNIEDLGNNTWNCICDDSLNFDGKLASNVATEDAVIAAAIASDAVAVATVLVFVEVLKCN